MSIGSRERRKEDPRLLRGGRYVPDVNRPGQFHAVILRSTQAHARITSVDLEAAKRMPGVAGAYSYADLAPVLRPIPLRLHGGSQPDLQSWLQLPLAPGEVRYVGEPIAVILARSRYEAEDARDAVRVEYEPLPVLTRSEEATPEDLACAYDYGAGDVDAVFAAADVVVTASFGIQRHTAVTMETRGLVAEYDGRRGVLTVWGAAKVPHFNRNVLAGMLGLPTTRIRFIENDVGGGFGVRGEFYPEDFLIPYLAMRLGGAIKWVEDRAEHLVASNHSREQVHHASLAARADGTILGLRDEFTCDMGGYIRSHGLIVPDLTVLALPGPYLFDDYRCTVRCAITNKTPIGTYRSPGRFEACFVRERLMDMLAARLELDPGELRRRNLIPSERLPFDHGLHGELHGDEVILDSGDFPRLFEQALERFGYEALRREQAEARAAGRQVGIGLACIIEKGGRGPFEYARVKVEPSGEVFVYSGAASVGQGVETTLAQICGEALGVPYGSVTVLHGDTDTVPYGVGAWDSRATIVGGSAVAEACAKIEARAREVGARLLESRPEDVELVDGSLRIRGTARSVSLAEVALALEPANALERGEEPLLEAAAFYKARAEAYSFGVHCCQVEVDPESGQVRLLRYLIAYDVGRAVNPTLVEGQLVGGCVQGIGGVLLEELPYDSQGQMLADTFMDYLLPSATEAPRIDVLIDEMRSPTNPLGVKGAGEGGVAGSPCIANAVADAIGAEVTRLPLSPARVWELSGGSPGRPA